MSKQITYKQLLSQLEQHNEEFDLSYTVKHLLVEECFNSELAEDKNWNDIADCKSLKELENIL